MHDRAELIAAAASWPEGGGETGALVRGYDWAGTSLGPVGSWPQSLRTSVELVLASPTAIVMLWGPDGIMIYNDAYSAFAGARHPRLFGSPVLQGWPEVAEFNRRVMDVGLRGETLSFREEQLTLFRQGVAEQVWLDLDYSPIRDETGRPAGVLAIVVETTQRVLAMRATAAAAQSLRESEAQFRSLAEALPHHVWIAGPDGALTWFNPRVYEYTGATPGELDEEAWARVVHPDDLERTFEAWSTAVRQCHVYENEFRLRNAAGQYRWFLARALPVRDAAGAVLRWLGTNTDLDDQKRAAAELVRLNATLEQRVQDRTAALLESQHRLRTFYDYSSECHVMLRACPDGSFVYEDVNPAVLRLYGMSREQVVGRSVDELFGADHAIQVNRHLAASLRNDGPYRYIREHGDRVIEAICAPVPSEPGEFPRIVVTAHDITESRRLEEQLRQAQKMEAVGQLTGGIAHDFNNLLQGIVGSLDLLQKRIEQGRIAEIGRYATGAMASAKRAAALTHRLLAFSRRQPLDPKPVPVNTLVASMEDLLRRTMGERIEIELVLAGGLWLTLCDQNQLESALLNLAINARDAMPDGGRLTIETGNAHLDLAYAAQEQDVRPGQYVCLSVTDSGTGMSPDVVKRAFDPFFTTKPTGQGTGLGLSMIYGFARQSEGYAKIYSEPGQGTTVKLYLPRHRGDGPVADPLPQLGDEHRADDGEVVLVVEDEAVVRALIVEVLNELGYRALQASDGPSGLDILEREGRIDLLVSDIGLPGLNGRQIADAARRRRPELKVLFMTGYAENAALASGFLEPGMAMITKPFAMEALATRIREMIEREQ